ncbi:hypothetical protein ACFYWY_36525 [Streptomyces sp. NPDC002870]|uniref:hypothetical protein n=1 Tax=Streptomyces sp. NPDC002870 TaxID=3364666 RepID=UPI0036A022EF
MALATGAYLWGTGYDLVSSTALTGSRSEVRAAAAWLAAVSLLLLVAYPCLRFVIGLLRGMWWPTRLASWAVHLQRRHRDQLVHRSQVTFISSLTGPADLADEAAEVIMDALWAKGLTPSHQHAEQLARGFARAVEQFRGDPSFWPPLDQLRREVAHLALWEAANDLPREGEEEINHRIAASLGHDSDLVRALDEFLAARIPLADRTPLSFRLAGELRPTALGNAEAAVVERVHRRYGLDVSLAWPRITVLLSEGEQRRLGDVERRADAATALAAGWLVATVGLVVTAAAAPGWPVPSAALLAAAAGTLAFCRTFYQQAVERAVSHGQLVEATVDLQRLPMLDALGWRRPRSPKDERALFLALSAALAGGRVADRFQRYSETTSQGESDSAELSAALAEAIDGLPRRLHATVDRSVARAVHESVGRELPEAMTASVLGGVERGLNETLEPAVERTLQRTLAGPKLDNFDGHLSVILLQNGVSPVAIDDTRRALLQRDQPYELVVAIGHHPNTDAATAPVRIRGGNDHRTVEFAVSIDSNIPTLRQHERAVVVEPRGEDGVRFPVRLDHTVAESAWLWVRVAQHGRTIQNLEITLIAKDQRS